MITPNYTSLDGRIRFYNCDCMELMESGKRWDLAVVDPPYSACDAIGLRDNKKQKKQAAKRAPYHLFENIAPKKEYFNKIKIVSKNQIVWGGNFFGLSGGVIAWNKNGTVFGEGEIAICSTHKSVRFFEYTWNGMLQQNMKNKQNRIHPTEKPIDLYRWILKNYAKVGYAILDTHGGSMSSAIACHMDGFELDICELDKEYFDAAVNRFKIYEQQQKLF